MTIGDNDLAREQSKRLQLAREHAGYKSARMAALRMGWKYPTYSAHENGTRKLTPAVANRYSKAFNVLAEFLLFGSNPPEWYGSKEEMHVQVVPLRYMRLFTPDSLATAANDDLSGKALSGREYAVPDSEELPPSVYAFRIESDEMCPPPGTMAETPLNRWDILIAEAMPEKIKPGDVVILYDEKTGDIAVRKTKGGFGRHHEYVASNPDFVNVSDEDAIVVGKALIHIRNLH